MKSVTNELRDLEIDKEIDKIRKELEELKKEKIEQEKQKREEFTLAQKMLILHYIGLIKAIDLPNTKKSLLFSKVLNMGKDNIRDILTYISSPRIGDSKIKNKENLEILVPFFKLLKMNKVVDSLNDDLSKLEEI